MPLTDICKWLFSNDRLLWTNFTASFGVTTRWHHTGYRPRRFSHFSGFSPWNLCSNDLHQLRCCLLSPSRKLFKKSPFLLKSQALSSLHYHHHEVYFSILLPCRLCLRQGCCRRTRCIGTTIDLFVEWPMTVVSFWFNLQPCSPFLFGSTLFVFPHIGVRPETVP